jgi:diguanylate cyclase (GGDEF)-like protein
MKALVIEDTLTSAAVVCQQLTRMGISPIHARDGAAGIEAFKREQPALVLLDIIMPGMDGFEVARRLRQLEQAGEWTPILFLSARASEDDLRRAIEMGGDDYLVKPVSAVVLAAKVRALQRIAQMRDSLLTLTRKLDEANRELTRLSAIDGLTGIANRRRFDETLTREWKRAARSGGELAVLAVDVDYFKQFNDAYGHQVGDECLKAVARALEARLQRPTDLVARYGGEEFFVVLPETGAEGAAHVGESLRQAVEDMAITHRHSAAAPWVTVSVGAAHRTAMARPERGFTALIEAADRALYEAKRQGRNRVALAPGLPAMSLA